MHIMRKRKAVFRSDQGAVLILVLWTLVILTAFTVNIGLRVRQKITLLARLEHRNQVRSIAFSCIQKAIAVLQDEIMMSQINGFNPLLTKIVRLNNPSQFRQIVFGVGSGGISYHDHGLGQDSGKQYGVLDEEGRLNLNTADRPALKRLIMAVLGMEEEEADHLADAIYDWRVYGESEIVGFFSDEYYDNLEFPYKEKKANFENLDELLLVRGVTERIYENLLPFITVYGDGKIDINTASAPVLMALGFSAGLAAKIVVARRGTDGIEATLDDLIFSSPDNLVGDLSALMGLSSGDTAEINGAAGKLAVEGVHFRIHGEGHLDSVNERKEITCVFNLQKNNVVYWREN